MSLASFTCVLCIFRSVLSHYNHLRRTGFGGAIDNGAITEFLDAGNSVLLAVDSLVTDEQRQLIADFGVDLEQAGTAVIDHFNHVVGDPDHAAITADVTLQARGVWGGEVLPVCLLNCVYRTSSVTC